MNLKFYVIVLSLCLFLGACNMSEHHYKKGHYDAALKSSIGHLKRKPESREHIEILQNSFRRATYEDSLLIANLHESGRPNRWLEVYELYKKMDARQRRVETVLPLYVNGQRVSFARRDYYPLISQAKYETGNYYYTHAKDLLQEGNRESCRRAFDELEKAGTYYSGFEDIDHLLRESYECGITNVLISCINNASFALTSDFLFYLVDFVGDDFNSQWIRYSTVNNSDKAFDVFIDINLNMIDVTGNSLSHKTFSETKQKEDGWEYKKDEDGNILKDSEGKKIKITKYKTLNCLVTEARQFKQAHLEAMICYVDVRDNMLLRRIPVSSDFVFEHFYYKVDGDVDALSPEMSQKVKSMPLPFPSKHEMLRGAGDLLRQSIYEAIMDNRTYVKQNY